LEEVEVMGKIFTPQDSWFVENATTFSSHLPEKITLEEIEKAIALLKGTWTINRDYGYGLKALPSLDSRKIVHLGSAIA
jgi:hypothetical protein